MIENNEGLLAALDRLQELQQMRKKIHSDSMLNHRQKVSELAGVRALIEEIECDVRQFHLTNLEAKLTELQTLAEKTNPAEMPQLVSQVISAMQELTRAIQPAN